MRHDTFQLQQGFNLIELMVTVAAVGILAAITVPAYQDYAVRAKVSEALGMGSAAKVAIVTNALVDQLEAMNQKTSGYDAQSNPGRYVAAIQIEDTGVIVMMTRNTGAVVDPVLELVPEQSGGNIEWDCRIRAGLARHVPPVCRSESSYGGSAATWRQAARENLVRVTDRTASGGFKAAPSVGSNGGLTTGEPALIDMKPTTSRSFDLKGVSVTGANPKDTRGGYAIVVQGQGEKENFSGYSIQFERSGEITLREWVNGKEQPTIKRTKLDKAFFDVGKAHDASVTINAGVVSVTANGSTVFTAENLKQQPGAFGVRTWNELELGVASSKATAT